MLKLVDFVPHVDGGGFSDPNICVWNQQDPLTCDLTTKLAHLLAESWDPGPHITLTGALKDVFVDFPHSQTLSSCLHSAHSASVEFLSEVLLSKRDSKQTRQDDPHVNISDKSDHPLHWVCVSSAFIGPVKILSSAWNIFSSREILKWWFLIEASVENEHGEIYLRLNNVCWTLVSNGGACVSICVHCCRGHSSA